MSTEISKKNSKDKTFINFNKANWTAFTKETEEFFSKARYSSDVHKDECRFRNIINKATKHHIPSGRTPKIFNTMATETAKLVDERDQIRKEDPSNPRLGELNSEINNQIKTHRQNKWTNHLASCGPGTKKLWDTIKSIDKPPRAPDNQSIKFNNVHYNNNKKLATQFNKQYTPNSSTRPTKEFRSLLRKIRKKSPDPDILITTQQTLKAIKNSRNSKAMGPDGISPIMLKHLGINGINFLTNLFNNSVKQAIIPTMWKTGKSIPLLKPRSRQMRDPVTGQSHYYLHQ